MLKVVDWILEIGIWNLEIGILKFGVWIQNIILNQKQIFKP